MSRIPGNFIESPPKFQEITSSTPFQSNINLNPPAPKKPHESVIWVGTPVPDPIDFNPIQNEVENHLQRKSARGRKQTDFGPEMVSNIHKYQANSVKLEPKSYLQAMKSDDRDLWNKAIEDEMDALNRNKTWDVVNRLKYYNIIGSNWVFKIKYKVDGSINRYKARLVAKGFSQQPGTDYDDTYAPVVRYNSLRLLLALAAQKVRNPRQLDVKSAFLYGNLDYEIYMEIPNGFKQPEKCYLLRKSIYGLKQSHLVLVRNPCCVTISRRICICLF